MSTAIDYAWQHPAPSVIKAGGHVAVLRYASQDSSKDLTPTEATELLAAGLDVGLVYEYGAKDALGGAAQGAVIGQRMAQRLANLGAPTHMAAYFAVDTGTQAYGVIGAFADAFRAQQTPGRPVGVYGSYAVGTHLLAQRKVDLFWQTAAWSAGLVSPYACLYQSRFDVNVGGVACDVNQIRHAYGGWNQPTQPHVHPTPPTPTHSLEDHVVIYRDAVTNGLYITDGIWKRPLASQADVDQQIANGAHLDGHAWGTDKTRKLVLAK